MVSGSGQSSQSAGPGVTNQDTGNAQPSGGNSVTTYSTLEHLTAQPTLYPSLFSRDTVHYISDVYCQLRPCAWREMLLANDDPDSLFILDGITMGFKLVDPRAEIQDYYSPNYYSAAVTSKEEVDQIIKSELSQGKFCIVHSKPTCVHAMGAIPKSSGGIRNITDCSKPKGFSINNYMKETVSTFKYKSMDDVTANLVPGTYMAVTDIASAYRAVPIRPSDRGFQGLQWELNGDVHYLEDNFLSFGTRVAPFIFSRLTDAIVRHLNHIGIKTVNYLDDFIVFGSDMESCRHAQLTLHTLLRDLGFHIAYKKVVSPSTVVTYLGIQIDSLSMTLKLPPSKMEKLHMELEFFLGRKRATLKQIQRLAGVLGYCSTLIRGGRTFSHRVISLLKCFQHNRRYVTLDNNFHLDLDWWWQCAVWFNGTARIVTDDQSDRLVLESDSSLSGYGAVCGEDWLAGAWRTTMSSDLDFHGHLSSVTPPLPDDNINVLELYPILAALDRWGESWRDKRITCKRITLRSFGLSIRVVVLTRILWLC